MIRVLLFSSFVCALSACVRTSPPAMGPARAAACRGNAVRWLSPEDAPHRARLDPWCAGVGLPAVQPLAASGATRSIDIGDVVFVSWNVHVGRGDIRSFIADLRAGALTAGRPAHHFVLMLQEALRSEGVPPYDATAEGASRIGGRDRSQDIMGVSRDFGLALVYVPSMRNGRSPSDPAADRGSALLSTLPLREPAAIELPGERQRRVAIVASVALLNAGAPLSVGVVHLDGLGSPRRLWVFWTPWMREMQVRALAATLPAGPLVLGADLNAWHGKDERAVRLLARVFERTPVSRERRGLGLRVLDYLFFRTLDNRRARYREADNFYGSDHRPLIGWVE
jgi:endonuclease/exonuclease/phosphatase family metal-dependent hydrolase